MNTSGAFRHSARVRALGAAVPFPQTTGPVSAANEKSVGISGRLPFAGFDATVPLDAKDPRRIEILTSRLIFPTVLPVTSRSPTSNTLTIFGSTQRPCPWRLPRLAARWFRNESLARTRSGLDQSTDSVDNSV